MLAPEIQLTLTPFSEQTLRRFLHIERPEGMDISTMAGQLEETLPPPPALTGPLVLPAPQAFSSVGQLYHGIEWGLRGLVDRYGEERVFVGSPNAQASPRCFRVPERMPELIPVTGLASAVQAIETIVEEGEGARGSWQRAHFGRFLEILEDYRALAADDASFAPARPAVVNPYVRVPRDLLGVAAANGPAAPDDPRGVHLIQDRYTAAVSDLVNACYAAMLQLLYRFFQRDSGDPAQAGGLDHPRRTAAGAGRGVRRPDRGGAGGAGRGRRAAGSVRGAAGASWCRGPGAASSRPGPGGRSTGWRRRRPEFRAGHPAVVHPTGPGRHALGVRPLEVASVRQHAEAILEQVAAGRMPCDAAWPAESVALFRRWVQAGSPD